MSAVPRQHTDLRHYFRLEHKITPRGASCIMLGPVEEVSCETFRGYVSPGVYLVPPHPPSVESRSGSLSEISTVKYRRNATRRSDFNRIASKAGCLVTTPEDKETEDDIKGRPKYRTGNRHLT